MTEQNIMLTILCLIILGVAIAIGITLFSEPPKINKPAVAQSVEVPASEPTSSTKRDGVVVSTGPARMQGIVRHYIANDYSLQYRGTVVGYSPNSDYLNGLEDGAVKREKIFIQITQSDGITKTQEVSYETWLILAEGSIVE